MKDETLPDDSPCRNADGTVCKMGVKKGSPCSRHGGVKSVKKINSAYKLDRFLLDDTLPQVMEHASSMKNLYEALGISTPCFYYWLDKGKADEEAGVDSLFREFYGAVMTHRRKAAQEMADVAMQAARGVKVWEEGKDTVYQKAPDGKLAMQIAARFDGFAMPAETSKVEHSGGVHVGRLDALRAALEEDDDE